MGPRALAHGVRAPAAATQKREGGSGIIVNRRGEREGERGAETKTVSGAVP